MTYGDGVLPSLHHPSREPMSTPSAPCHVFTPEWTAKQHRKYGGRPPYDRPRLYDFWTSEAHQPARTILEGWVDALPPEGREEVIPRLRDPRLFEHTYNEMAVGNSLRRMGHVVDHEVEMDGLTPDWLARPRG